MKRNSFSIRKYRNTFWTSYWRKGKQANELFYHSKLLKTCQSLWNVFEQKQGEQYWRDFKNFVAHESTIVKFKQNVYKIVNVLLKLLWYMKYSTAALLMQTCKPNPRNETQRVSEKWIFTILKNLEFVIIRHNMNVFIILKAHFVKKTAPD